MTYKFCKHQIIQTICEEHDFKRLLCSYNHKDPEPYCICPIQPEEIQFVPNTGTDAVYLAIVLRCPKFNPVNLSEYLKVTDLTFDKNRYSIMESDLEYILVDNVEEEKKVLEEEDKRLSEYDELKKENTCESIYKSLQLMPKEEKKKMIERLNELKKMFKQK